MHQISARRTPLSSLLPPTPQTPLGIDRLKTIGYPGTLPPIHQAGHLEAPVRIGLRTPPEEDMHVAHPEPQYSNYYKSLQNETYSRPVDVSGSATRSRQPPPIPEGPGAPASRINNLFSQPDVPFSWPPIKEKTQADSFHSAALSALESESTRKPQAKKPSNTDPIHPSLRIPKSINDSGGSLAEFAAQITCLFWFESTETLKRAENSWAGSTATELLRPEAFPSVGFTKWVVTILMTTQVSQNVILLALLFIYRLKSIVTTVKGRTGSEFRLLTVALMLGNKFLDDNTYTNKTWAEVSGISVTEIHIMEVEFLSNMRYSLLASEDEWKEWQQKLGKFWSFCNRATKIPSPQPTLPSLPVSSPSTQTSQYSSVAGPFNFSPQWPVTNNAAYLVSLTTTSNTSEQDFCPNARKRSITEDAEEPVAKRASRSTTSTPNGPGNFNMADRPRLPPVPNLKISTSQAMCGYNGLTSFSQNAPLLPPLNCSRAISTVYPTTPTFPAPISSSSHTPKGPQSSGPQTSGPQTAPYQHSNQSFGTSSRQRSPHSAVHELLASASSPLNTSFPGNSGHISPSVFYQQRNSPYKPIRHVNTLLYPPPSTSMHDYTVNTNHMHYQPLGKRHDYRSGVVPGYGHELFNQWPILPQPNCTGY